MNKENTFFLPMILLSILILTSCNKDEPTVPIVNTDPRDRVTGEYEVWDTFFLYHKSSKGQDSFVFEGIFHYSKIQLTKQRVSYSNLFGTTKFNDGLAYTPIIVDNNFTSTHGFTKGFYGNKHLFTFYKGSPPRLEDQDDNILNAFFSHSDYSGTVLNDSCIVFKSYTYENSKSNAFVLRKK